MAQTVPTDVILPTQPARELPVVRSIGMADLRDAFAKGVDDFRAMPTHVIFLSLIYPIIGLVLFAATFGYNVIPLLLSAGGGLCPDRSAGGHRSLRAEPAPRAGSRHVLAACVRRPVHSPSLRAIAALGALLLAIFFVWLAVAHAIYVANFALDATDDFGHVRPAGADHARRAESDHGRQRRRLPVRGAGLLVSLISFPLLLDRNVGVAVAIVTSIKAILKNPMTMALWGLFVAGALAIGSLPFFIGLAVVMPVLGHSTWHLYRKVVEPDLSPRPEYHPRPRRRHYAADFPVSLFWGPRARTIASNAIQARAG